MGESESTGRARTGPCLDCGHNHGADGACWVCPCKTFVREVRIEVPAAGGPMTVEAAHALLSRWIYDKYACWPSQQYTEAIRVLLAATDPAEVGRPRMVGADELRALRGAYDAAGKALDALDGAADGLRSARQSLVGLRVTVATPCSWCGSVVGVQVDVLDGWGQVPLGTLCPDCRERGKPPEPADPLDLANAPAGSLAERHMIHYRSCDCLGDSGECCIESCPCHEEAGR